MEEQSRLRLCQLEELELLQKLHQVCAALGLKYYLTAGTLLGAVRYEGFIPWDDDIDVAMPRRDFNQLAKLGQQMLGEKYFLQNDQTEPNFPYAFAKIRKKGTSVREPILGCIAMDQGIYIDIFPLDLCPDQARLARLFFKGVELIGCAVLSRVSMEFVCGYQRGCMLLLWHLLRRLPNRLLFILREGLRHVAGLVSSGRRLCTVGGHHGYPREVYKSEWFHSSVMLPFEGDAFPAPADWDSLLTSMYGDYRTPPAETERQGHFIVERMSQD